MNAPVTPLRTGRPRTPAPVVRVRLFRSVVWLLFLAGPVLGVWALVYATGLSSRVESIATATVVNLPPPTAGAAGFAELYLAGFLADRESSSRFSSDRVAVVGRVDVADPRLMVVRVVSLGATEIGPGYFSVDLAATTETVVTGVETGEELSLGETTSYWRVGVLEADDGWSVTAPPSLVAPPGEPAAPDLWVGSGGLDSHPGLSDTVSGVLSAYLTGEGDVVRYLRPGDDLIAPDPAPFVSVEVVASGARPTTSGLLEVVARIRATDPVGLGFELSYTFLVVEREGRWEITELLPAPTVATTAQQLMEGEAP